MRENEGKDDVDYVKFVKYVKLQGTCRMLSAKFVKLLILAERSEMVAKCCCCKGSRRMCLAVD